MRSQTIVPLTLALNVCALGQLTPVREPGIGSTQERLVFFSGAVALEDGSAPPQTVLIQKVCDGRSQDEGWTDARGQFGFKVDAGKTAPDATDASQGSGLPSDVLKPMGSSSQYSMPITSALRGCEVQAVLPGFRSDRVSIALKTLDNTRLGSIVLHPISRATALTVSATSLAAPPNAKKAYEKGLAAASAQKWDSATSEFTKAVKTYPAFAVAWYQLGTARQKANDAAGAKQAWEQALKSDPKYLKPYEMLSMLAYGGEDWPSAEKYTRGWIQLDGEDFPAAYLLNAIANARLNRADEAEHAAREGLRIDKNGRIPRLNYVLGLLLIDKREYAESLQCFRRYLELAPGANDAAIVRQQVSQIEHATGRTN